MKEFFQNLRDKREETGITLEEIHRRTYLPLNYLQDIEAGNLQSLPCGYERIYLKRYAAEIGVDCNEVLRDYDMLSGSAPETKRRSNIFPSGFEKLNLDKLYKYFWIFMAVVIIAITGFISYNQYIAEKQNQITVKEIPTSNISDNSATLNNINFIDNRAKDSATMRQPAPITDKKDSFVVRLKAIDTTWVRQIRDIKDTTEYTLPTGLGHSVVVQKQVQFMVGKGDGVEFWLNGVNLGIMGQADEVILSLIISEKGVVEKRLKKVAKKDKAKADSTVAIIPVLY
jgi:cytoskeletal protein RodZ